MMKKIARRIFESSPVEFPLRRAYHRLWNRDEWKRDQSLLAFYSQYVSKGDLVFDVGANIGLYTDLFLRLGAQVVSVEPNPQCAAVLRSRYRTPRVAVEEIAVGDCPKQADLFLCSDSTTHSTLSSEWLGVARHVERLTHKEWNVTTQVGVTTLDGLIAKYGFPGFIKIDVEGYEREVLSGLSIFPRCLSFEFISDFSDAALACIGKPCFPDDAEFNFIMNPKAGEQRSETVAMVAPRWLNRGEIREVVNGTAFREGQTYGDIFVRRKP